MHIGYFVSGWPLSSRASGVVTYVDVMKRELETLGHQVSIFSGGLDSTGGEQGVHLVRHQRSGSLWGRVQEHFVAKFSPSRSVYAYGRSIASAVSEVHARTPLDVFEIEESFGWSSEIQAICEIPVVVRLHGPTFLVQNHLLGRDADIDYRVGREGQALQQAEFITAPTRCTLDDTVSRYGLRPSIVRAIPNPFAVPPEPLPRRFSKNSRELLFVGRFDLIKGADLLLDAFSQVAESYSDVQLIFVGPDIGIPRADGQLEKFHSYVERNLSEAVRRKIVFLGQQTPEQIKALRRRAAAVLVTSRWESQSYVLLESFSEKCPVVAFAAGGIAEAVEHERNGLLAPPGEIKALVRQIERLLAEPDLGRDLAEEGYRYVTHTHDPGRIAQEMTSIYRDAQRSS